MKKAQLKVDPIKKGTVIDHISAGKALQVADILNL
jgi:aspartate carbamoyltransferase regulatory subunit